MLAMMQDLVRHKAWADAALFAAIRAHANAADDPELLRLLHHVILANRFWLSLFLDRAFDREGEARQPETLDAIAAVYRRTQEDELAWISRTEAGALQRRVETHYLPGRGFSVAEALMQVCMHSQGHRAQCAARLRSLGGEPPVLDFLLWLNERPVPAWR